MSLLLAVCRPLRRGERFYAESVLCDVKGASLKVIGYEDSSLLGKQGLGSRVEIQVSSRPAALPLQSLRLPSWHKSLCIDWKASVCLACSSNLLIE